MFPSAATMATRFPSLSPAIQTVMSVRRRPSRKDGEGFATRAAETAPYPDPVVVFVVGLLAPLAVADDGMVPQRGQRRGNRANGNACTSNADLSRGSGSAIKRIKAGVKAHR